MDGSTASLRGTSKRRNGRLPKNTRPGADANERRHYREYRKSPACENFLTVSEDVFLAADKASIESYLNPIRDDAEPIIPRGDLGSFVLAVRAAEERFRNRSNRGGGADQQRQEFDGTVRVLGRVLFDDFWALLSRNALRMADLAKMAEVHPRQVYVGPSVPMEREGWRKSGVWSLTTLKSFETWRAT